MRKELQSLSWFDMESWAGERVVSRGRAYQRDRRVRDLAITEAGELIAKVAGSTTYATKVFLENGSPSSICTCPYHRACKHAVAVVLEYLGCVEAGITIPTADENDERLKLLEDFDYMDDELYDEEDDVATITNHKEPSLKPGFDNYLRQKSKKELLEIINEVIVHHPDIGEELNYKARIAHGKPSALVKTVEREIVKASSEPGWRNYWKHTGYTPDYSRVRSGLQKLLDEGRADEVVRLGEKLFSLGITQIEQSNDEGETADEVANTLPVVFRALAECSMPNVDKMETAVNFGLRDEYGLCNGIEIFWKQRFSKNDWDLLAGRLFKRLNSMKHEGAEEAFSRNYRRDRLTDEIINALEKAGRSEEVLALCREEAEKTHSYERLVKRLCKAGLTDEAEEWIRRGISETREKWPGITRSLKKDLMDIRTHKKDWLFVASLLVDEFLSEPSLMAFEDLRKASEKAKVWPQVRETMMLFLETGKRPGEYATNWPLTDIGIKISGRCRMGRIPNTPVLIDIAIHEQRVEDVLKWFELHKKRPNNWPEDHLNDEVATAIASKYPDKSVEIWKRLAEKHISVTNVSSYAEGAQYLRKAQKILKQTGKETEWEKYLQALKEKNRRKPRCIQILDGLSEKPIIKSKR